ncbi:MAG: class F sortase [Patescibacteria group bacterium]|jgi:LPXTG-site transpeptidase (sortase) family protein
MKSTIFAKRGSLKIILIGIAFSLGAIFYLIPIRSTQSSPALPVKATTSFLKLEQIKNEPASTSPGLPVRLKIPKIKVNAAFESVGLTPKGAVGVPKNFSNVAWFNISPRPGENGSAVVTGHYGRKNGKGSVFDNLHKLRPGDKLYVQDNKGATAVFVVRESRRYDPKANVSDIFNVNDGKVHLNLITCEGVWDPSLKSYSRRLVVFTDQESGKEAK